MKSHFLQNSMLYASLLLCVGFFALASNTMYAQVNADTLVTQEQNVTVSGLVSDADGPIIGAKL